MKRSELHGHLALLIVQVCFGLLPLLGKLAFVAFGPRAVAAWRIAVGALVFSALALAVYGRRFWPRWRDLPRLQVLALLGVSLNQVLFLEGLERTTSVNAGLLVMLIPVFVFTLAVLVRQERYSATRALGIAIAFAATAGLALQRDADLGPRHLTGNLLIVANMLLYSGYVVGSRPLTRQYPALVMIAWMFVLSAWTIPVFLGDTPLFPDAEPQAWLSLGLVLLLPTILAYLLHLFALARLRASTSAVYVFLQPLIAGTAGVLVLHEPLRGTTLVAAVAIFVGLWLVVRPSPAPGPT